MLAKTLGKSLEEVLNLKEWELRAWTTYFQQFPLGFEEDQRAFLIMKSLGVKARPEQIFSSFKQMAENEIMQQQRDNQMIMNSVFGLMLRSHYEANQ